MIKRLKDAELQPTGRRYSYARGLLSLLLGCEYMQDLTKRFKKIKIQLFILNV